MKPTGEKSLQILQKRIDDRISEARQKSRPMLETIERDGNMLEDFILPLGEKAPVEFEGNGDVRMIVSPKAGKAKTYTIHPHAVTQAGEKLGIAPTYIRDLAYGAQDWQRKLAAHILNEHTIYGDRQRVLVRAVGDQVRGVLSDQYRRLSSPTIIASFLKAIKENDAQVIDAFGDELRWSIEIIRRDILPVTPPITGRSI